MKGFLIAAAAIVYCFVGVTAVAQSSNATLGGTVADASRALIPELFGTGEDAA
jgi:hypothetical protein